MTRLSYSTINELYSCRQSWLNKLMGLEKYDTGFFKEGREAHRVIQDHVSGKMKDGRLYRDGVDILPQFSVVEEVDYDPRLKFEVKYGPEYSLMGYMDGKDEPGGRMLEIKTASVPWSPRKLQESMQWRFYALCNPWIKEVYLVTCTRDLQNVKVMHTEVTPKDIIVVKKWIDEAISIIELGDFTSKECKSCFYINCPCPGCKNIRRYG